MSGVDQDIVAVGLDLKPETLIKAYSNGVFPWPTPGYPMLWYCPRKRAILKLDQIHIGKRLHQYLKHSDWSFTLDTCFEDVINACAERKVDEGTWITPEMKSAYREMHQLGHAHSFEVWNKDKLIGGLYGIDMAGTFAGESMFHRETNASKAAVLFASFVLKDLGRKFMDIQVLTPHMENFGAEEMSRGKFLKLIQNVQSEPYESLAKVNKSKWVYHSHLPGKFIEV